MEIIKFFDPYNMEHIKAYKHMITYGFWQEGFLPKDIEYADNATWQIVLAFKMTNVWVEQVLAGNVIGMPPVVPPCNEV
jgi:hypothetical protein